MCCSLSSPFSSHTHSLQLSEFAVLLKELAASIAPLLPAQHADVAKLAEQAEALDVRAVYNFFEVSDVM